jgi:hypothetical protein
MVQPRTLYKIRADAKFRPRKPEPIFRSSTNGSCYSQLPRCDAGESNSKTHRGGEDRSPNLALKGTSQHLGTPRLWSYECLVYSRERT